MIEEGYPSVPWIGFSRAVLALIYFSFKGFGRNFVAERPVSAGALTSGKLQKDSR